MRRLNFGFVLLNCLALASLTSGCGGGGGGGDAASMSVQSSTPSAGATGVNPDGGSAVVAVRIHGFSDPRGGAYLNCGSEQFAGTSQLEWKAGQEILELRVDYDGLPGNANCTLTGQADATNATGPNTVNWSIPFTTTAARPLHYGPLLVGILGERTFVLDFQAGSPLRREPVRSTPPRSQRGLPTPYWFGTALSASGRIPLAAIGHGVAGPYGVLYRFNPVTLQYSIASSADTMPADHELNTSSLGYGSGWKVTVGGVGPAPTPTAKFWTTDGSGGWFYVEEASQDTLRRRTAAGQSSVVHQQVGELFGSLRVFSH